MSHEWIALLIMAVTIVLYFAEIIPIYLTAIISALAMVVFGIIPFSDAFSTLSSNTIFVIIGMSVISKALSVNGITEKISGNLLRFSSLREKTFLLVAFIFVAVCSTLISALVALTMFLPVIDDVVERSEGRYSYRQMYMFTAVGSTLGGLVTSMGLSSTMNASALLEKSGYGRGMRFFEPASISVPILIGVALVYVLFGYRLQKRAFNFDDRSLEIKRVEADEVPVYKKVITSVVTIACVICFILEVMPTGLTSMLGAVILLATKCVDQKRALRDVNWNMIFVLVGSVGFATGLDRSGATAHLVGMFGQLLNVSQVNPYVPCVLMLLLCTVISNFMSNNSAIAITVPVAIQLAQTFGIDAMALVMACTIGANISLATPICTSSMMMTTSCGYRFKDYIAIGGLYNLTAFAVSAVMLYVVYFI